MAMFKRVQVAGGGGGEIAMKSREKREDLKHILTTDYLDLHVFHMALNQN